MKIYNYIKFVIFIALAVLLCIYHYEALDSIKYIVSSLMMFFGLEGVVLSIVKNKKKCLRDIWLTLGAAEFLIGITVILGVNGDDEFVTVCIVWAVWTILREAVELHEIAKGEVRGLSALISGVESIVAIVFSVMLIITPVPHHAHTHVILLIVELIVTVLVPLIPEIGKRYKEIKEKKNNK